MILGPGLKGCEPESGNRNSVKRPEKTDINTRKIYMYDALVREMGAESLSLVALEKNGRKSTT